MTAKEMQHLPKETADTLKGTPIADKAPRCTKNERSTLPRKSDILHSNVHDLPWSMRAFVAVGYKVHEDGVSTGCAQSYNLGCGCGQLGYPQSDNFDSHGQF